MIALPPAVASDVYVATGLLDESIVEGRVIGYRDFEVWPATSRVQQTIACRWSGTWNTPYGPMRLTQRGATVSGDYDWDQGQISGRVSDEVLGGTWTEAPSRQPPTDAGQFQFTMSDDCQSFAGQWRYGASEAWRPGWSGQRLSN